MIVRATPRGNRLRIYLSIIALIQWFEHDVGGAIPVGRLERISHLTGCRQRQALAGHRGPAHVTAQAFELLALIRRNVHTGMQ
jgi:hypothetical protein